MFSPILILIIFAVTFIWLATERAPRHITMLCGAGALMLLGIVSPYQALLMINWVTLGILLILFIVVGFLFECNVFNLLGSLVIKVSRGNPTVLFFLLPVLAGVLSMFLNNIAIMLFFSLLTLEICRASHIDPVVLITSEVCAANAGGGATLIGSPPSLLMGTTLGYGFKIFLLKMGPLMAAALLLMLLIYFLMQRHLLNAPQIPLRPTPGWKKLPQRLLINICKQIDWQTLLFFIGMFVMVGTLDRAGIFRFLAQMLVTFPLSPFGLSLLVLIGTALLSAFVDNIPMALAMAYIIKDLRHLPGAPPERWLVWTALAGLTLGGNLTPIGASPNIVAYAVLERSGKAVGWKRWAVLTGPPTLAALAGVSLFLWIKYLPGGF